MKNQVFGWHFVGSTLRDGSPVPRDGKWLRHNGPIKMCFSGLHGSLEPFDALTYAPGNTLCYCEFKTDIEYASDKLVCRERKILYRMDASELLRYFARMQALSVVDLWNPPQVVLDYLMTGDECIRTTAWGAARGAARAAAWEAARDAARAAARADFNSLVYECFGLETKRMGPVK